MTLRASLTLLTDSSGGTGGSAYAAATWNTPYLQVADTFDSHWSGASQNGATVYHHFDDSILSAADYSGATNRSSVLSQSTSVHSAIDELVYAWGEITGYAAANFHTAAALPNTIIGLSTAVAGQVTGGVGKLVMRDGTGAINDDILGYSHGVKGPAAGRLLLGAGSSAMTAFAGATTGDVVQWDTTLNGGAGGWKAGAFSAFSNVAPGSLSFSDLSGGYVTADNADVTLSIGADTMYDLNGKFLNIAATTYQYGVTTPAISVPGAFQYRVDFLDRTTTGALRMTPGVAQSSEAAALANAPALTSTTGKPLAFIVLGPNTTAIHTLGPSSSGNGYVIDARSFGFPAAALVANTTATNQLLNATSSAAVNVDTSGNVLMAPTLGGWVKSSADVEVTGVARFRMTGGYYPANGSANPNYWSMNTLPSDGTFPAPYAPTQETLRETVFRVNNMAYADTTGANIESNTVFTGRPIATVIVGAGGTGYTTAPTVVFARNALDAYVGALPTATATISGGAVTGVTINTYGKNLMLPPIVTFTGGGGTGAAATATLAGFSRTGIHTKIFTPPDAGESSAILGIQTGGGSGATFYKMTSYRSQIVQINGTLTALPNYYDSPQGAVEMGTDGASQAFAAGAGTPFYTPGVGNTVTLGFPMGIGTDWVPLTSLTGFVVPGSATPAGNIATTPQWARLFGAGSAIDGSNGVVEDVSYKDIGVGLVVDLVLTAGGSGYTTGATVTIAPPTSGTTATATATVTGGVVTGLVITNYGRGYTSAPTVTITPVGAGSGATATSSAVTFAVMAGVTRGVSGTIAQAWATGTNVVQMFAGTVGVLSVGGPGDGLIISNGNGTGNDGTRNAITIGQKVSNAVSPSAYQQWYVKMNADQFAVPTAKFTYGIGTFKGANQSTVAQQTFSDGSHTVQGTLSLIDTTVATGAGGALMLGGAGGTFGGLKAFTRDTTNNTTGDIIMGSRAVNTDAAWTARQGWALDSTYIGNPSAFANLAHFKQILVGTQAQSLGATLAAGITVPMTVAVANAALGDMAVASCTTGFLGAGIRLTAEVTAAGTVTVEITNTTGATYTYPSSGNITIKSVVFSTL